MSSAPGSINTWLEGGAAASHREICGGIMFGQTLIPSPLEAEEYQAQRQDKGTGVAGGARAQAPDPQAQSQHQNWHRHEPEEIGQRKPAFRHVAPAQRRPDADHRNHHHQRQQYLAGQLAHPLLQRAFAFHNQPRGAQQQIGHHQPQTAEQIERGKPVQRRTGEAAVSHRKAVDKRADDNPWLKVANSEPPAKA